MVEPDKNALEDASDLRPSREQKKSVYKELIVILSALPVLISVMLGIVPFFFDTIKLAYPVVTHTR
jgi:hypothetical protein